MTSGLEKPKVVVICGPTGTGKTALAVEIGKTFRSEVISADSRQVYRMLDIGTAKATAREQAAIRHHMIDMVDPDEDFSVADFVDGSRLLIDRMTADGLIPLVAGGTGLYIKGLTEGLVDTPPGDPELRKRLRRREENEGEGTLYGELLQLDPELAERLSPRDLVRIERGIEVAMISGKPLSLWQREHAFAERPYHLLKIGLAPERDLIYRRTDLRVERMIAEGLVEEVRNLLDLGYAPHLKSMKTLGYREIVDYLCGTITLVDAVERIKTETRRYVKRQLTWFRADPDILWFDSVADSAKVLSLIEKFSMNT